LAVESGDIPVVEWAQERTGAVVVLLILVGVFPGELVPLIVESICSTSIWTDDEDSKELYASTFVGQLVLIHVAAPVNSLDEVTTSDLGPDAIKTWAVSTGTLEVSSDISDI